MKRLLCAFIALMIIFSSAAVTVSAADDAPVSPEGGDWDALIAEFMEANSINPDTVSFAYCNTVTGEEHYFRGDRAMTAASVNKLPLNMYYAEKVYNGEISWETTYKGVQYKLVQEYSLRYSNNEYSNALIDAIGDYTEFRKAILPYIGLAEEDVEFAYLKVNEFTAQQIMHCLKLLHAEPERYPGVMDNLLLATPGEYFELNVSDYDIAQKFGWYVVDGHNYINCVGIVNTEEPILLAAFSDNCHMGKTLLGEYCALMVSYTENTIAAQKSPDEEKVSEDTLPAENVDEAEKPEVSPQPASTPQPSSAPQSATAPEAAEKEEPESSSGAENALRLVACVAACALLALALGLANRIKKKPAEPSEKPGRGRKAVSCLVGAAAVILTAATLIVCCRGLEAKPLIMSEGSDPAAVAEEFMDLALSGESAAAEKLLLGSSSLGLDSLPEDRLGSMLYEALLASFSYEPAGDCVRDSIEASALFTVTYLDLPSVTALQQEATAARLAQYVETAQRAEEVLAEDGSYLPEVAMRALEEVTAELLEDAESHYVQTELKLRLRYSGGEWRVIADEELFAVLSGNAAY